ncbi:MAG: murein biosynthesis integral membrane protein MurJ [Deltaproteobacteria bacterium RIFCSPLOWO2_02_FULL_50_16]|nr:MAG: murein biosynthesis integral membrane protein MurJ [Deltaproteobacteria bacterium GWA2_50_8]OGQ26671.1 MAG: murein biosynthesis integral membrane protein MurJ [Deltaproteobacteria bacterium RIFCSPHIGHO2_02_FULL_50_15]OGQ57787.1 MAG: murein biosynthesis integral membrane protein MurJ [Deltaproteobacteria bacterium RIFCSPLOWO2_02_FULL_50_16]OGQ68763.1 MAG: murein biosynthesis integral membrane protein MurJ [Deltaproteobacteria bacterium RIFCSPLOWO2_12_FULL_50_11]
MSEEKNDIIRRTGTVSGMTFLSRLLGLIRDVIVAHVFGAKSAADAFFVAFRIPNLFRRLLAEGALTVSFVPVFSEYLKQDREEAKKIVGIVASVFLLILLALSSVAIIVAPWIVRAMAFGFSQDPEKFALTVTLTRLLFPYLVFVSLAALAMGVLNSLKHFAAPASSPIFLNIGIIIGALFLTPYFDPPVMGLAWGVLLGGLLQLAINVPVMVKYGFFPRLRWNPRHPAVKKIVHLMIPSAYGAAVYQFNVVIITLLASFLPSGAVSYLWYADRLMEFPVGIFGISVAAVILPTLSDHAAHRNWDKLNETLSYGLRLTFFISIPAAVGLIVLAEPIIRVIFQHGSFTDHAAQATAQALLFFALGLPFISGVRVVTNAYYSFQEPKTPVKVANLSVLVNLILALLLMKPLKHNGLALAISLSSFFNFFVQVILFQKRMRGLRFRDLVISVSKICLASLIMGGLILWGQQKWPILEEKTLILQMGYLMAFVFIGVAIYGGVSWLVKSQEMREVLNLWNAPSKK